MREKNADFAVERIINARWAGVVFLLLSVPMISRFSVVMDWPYLVFALLLTGAALTTWLLDVRDRLLGEWFGLIGGIGLIGLAVYWLREPESLVFLPTLVVLARVMTGQRAALVVAGLSLVLLFVQGAWSGTEGMALAGPLVISLAITWGLLLLQERAVADLIDWTWNHYQRANQLLEDARNRQAELMQMQDDLLQSNLTLTIFNKRLAALRVLAEEAEQAKTAFVARISHELRTPLNMIIGLIDTVTETPHVYGVPLPPLLLKDLEIVRRNSDHLASMINDVLALSRAESGQLTLHRSWTDLAEEIANAATIVKPLLDKKGLALDIAISDDLPPIYCDHTRIREVILNLMSNAARYTEQGGIQVQASHNEHSVTIRISDTGPGIAAEHLERIFEPFQQTGRGNGPEQSGSGLGLSISQHFIERHDGRIWVESEVGVGSIFAFRLPILPLSVPASSPSRWVREEWVFRERTIWPYLPQLPYSERFILWDEGGLLSALVGEWSTETELIETHSLAETVQVAREHPAQAVLLNGSTTIHTQSLLEQTRRIIEDTPLIGFSLPPPIDSALNAGALDYLLKPVTQRDLQEALDATGLSLRRVLVVDDREDFRSLIVRMLQLYDTCLEIATAADGPAALESLRAQPPDLMLLDIAMPGMDGWEVLERQQQDVDICHVPVILLSALDQATEKATSPLLMAAMGQGISLSRLMHCARHLARLLLSETTEPDPAPG
jgi:signal transduction histidine kinase/CheY-like chemotaxis protein